MKKITFLSFAAALFFLTSCETIREISLKDNGSGEIATTLDASQLVGIMKMSGQGKEMENQKLDSTISLAAIADSIPDLEPAEKELLKKGSMGMVLNMEDEKMLVKTTFPFNDITEVPKIQKLSGKLMQEAMKKEMENKSGGAQGGMPGGDMPQGFDEYFTTTYSAGVIEMKLNREKYANLSEDKAAQGLKQAIDQGMPMVSRYIIHLPQPAKKVEGANTKLSEDKKTVTIENDMSGFFDDATKMEFRVEY